MEKSIKEQTKRFHLLEMRRLCVVFRVKTKCFAKWIYINHKYVALTYFFLFRRYFLLHLLHKKSFKLSKQQNGITSNANIDF